MDLGRIAEQTKIKLSLLEALEHDDVSHWPSGIFRRAYIRTYAQFIGLDPDVVLREFLEAHPDPDDDFAALAAAAGVPTRNAAPPTRLRTIVESALSSLAKLRRAAASDHTPSFEAVRLPGAFAPPPAHTQPAEPPLPAVSHVATAKARMPGPPPSPRHEPVKPVPAFDAQPSTAQHGMARSTAQDEITRPTAQDEMVRSTASEITLPTGRHDIARSTARDDIVWPTGQDEIARLATENEIARLAAEDEIASPKEPVAEAYEPLAPAPPAAAAAAVADPSTGDRGSRDAAAAKETDIQPSTDSMLETIAHLCTELGQVGDRSEVQRLMQDAARVFDATGLIVWLWDELAEELRPALVHGYSERIVAHLPAVGRDADNATAAAFRSVVACEVVATAHTRGALVFPLLVAGGCAGVLALELPHGFRPTRSARTAAALLAAALAQLVHRFRPAPTQEPAEPPVPVVTQFRPPVRPVKVRR
jgi:cytoskeleton protein RodZ